MKLKYIIVLLFTSLCYSCSSDQQQQHLDTNLVLPNIISLPTTKPGDEFSARQRAKQKNKRRIRANRVHQKRCRFVISKTVPALVELAKLLDRKSIDRKSDIWKMTRLKPAHCKKNRKFALATISNALNYSSHKIGVILPLTGRKNKISGSIISGLTSASMKLGLNYKNTFVVKNSLSNKMGTLRALAELIFNDKVSFIITGMEELEATSIIETTKQLMIPTLILNGKTSIIDDNNYAFQVFPKQQHLAEAITESLLLKGIKRAAILKPTSGKANHLVDQLLQDLDKNRIRVTHNISYQTGNYDSMEAAARQVAGIDFRARRGEYKSAYRRARRRAKQNGETFNPRLIVLPARLETDAIIIPDNFRIVRHYVNLLKYHGIKKVTLVGNHEWRSKSIIEPWDDFLQGSVFVDFIGAYNHLPIQVTNRSSNSAYFADPSFVSEIDFRLIGFRVATIALRALKEKQLRRRDYISNLAGLKSEGGFYTSDLVFNKKRVSNWPTFIFNIHDRNLSMVNARTRRIGLLERRQVEKERKLRISRSTDGMVPVAR